MIVLQMYLRDAKQAEVLLNQQENFLSKEEVPVWFCSIALILEIMIAHSILHAFPCI